MAKERGDLLQGTLDMLVLKALQLEPMHGWGITERIEQWSEHILQLGQGTLYPALYRLERQGLIRSEWKVTENSRRARYYSLTREGRRHLSEELAQWRRMSRAVNLVLEATQRTREIGIRVALGARPGELQRMFVRHGLVLAGIGASCGLIAAVTLTRFMTSLLFGISPLDPATYAVVSLVLALAAALASFVPAHRATIVDPVETLRAE